MTDHDVYLRQGFGSRLELGHSPALLIVDFVNGFADPGLFGGGNIPAAIASTVPLLAAVRRTKAPIVFTRVVYPEGSSPCVFLRKIPRLALLTEDAAESQVVAELAPRGGEHVVNKQQPSAFFDTGVAEWLRSRQVDTLLVTGCTTSGCVRASVVDAMSYNFSTVVITNCVGDRAEAPHRANLFDMDQKYAELMSSDEVLEFLARGPQR